MKIVEAITRIDGWKHNTYTQADKVAWLSMLDGKVKSLVIDTHEGGEDVSFTPYDATTDLNTELLIGAPYAEELYMRWLEAQIDYYNGEFDKYNNSIETFNAVYADYANYYNRTHMPKGQKFKYF